VKNDDPRKDTLLGVAIVVLLLLGLLVIALLLFGPPPAFAVERSPPCTPGQPIPALQVELPDGTVIGAARIDYDVASRRAVVTGDPRMFCSGFED
jgi:uncharacterized protein (DUF58 family)